MGRSLKLQMELEPVRLPVSQPLADAFVNRTDARIEALFGYHPAEASHWTQRLEWLEAHRNDRVAPDLLAAALRTFNKRFNGSDAAVKSIEAIAAGAPVIVGGQQAGLWTGPLLVIHKAVTILSAARHASDATGRPVVPVFWIAGEDHDWDEANHAFIVSQQSDLVKIALDRPSAMRSSVSRTRLAREALEAAVAKLTDALQDTEFKPELIGKLKEFAQRSSSLTEWFAFMMGWLFGDQGLVLLDADDPALRRLEGPMFRRMIERNDELERAYLHSAATVQSYGYGLQADVAEGGANLFLFREEPAADASGEAGAERTLLFKRDGRFVNRRGTLELSREELLAAADETPEMFSNNVLTRPLMQDYVLPVLGTVLGSGEIAYWTLTAEAFRTMGMQMPIIVPRMSFTLIDGTSAKFMKKFGLSLEDVALRFEERKEQWLKEQDELDIDGSFEEAKRRFAELYEPVIGLAAAVQGGMAELGEKNKLKIVEQIGYLQARTKDAHAKRYEAIIRQLDGIALALWPDGKPQERVVNAGVYWNRYGSAWIGRLLEAPFEPCGSHRIVYL
ncbi:bacillithiol biosynthesis cysteine-adding enzyme BshC [Paenibacillus humicola]|uniref:bacillithiol biosynthesis cysteine-adding enzyme BshC n=1 Tax=Paenibacillus humicola TaxID=3110540 RepID=UPI00237B19EB|nr:bacillithiol biosynthesis cysteine-adding enzyme BshC [Paenibacillus humicola]